MEKILLIDVDSKYPNLALMKISAWHKARGDEVGFRISDPDKVYASCIFNKNKHNLDGLEFMYPSATINRGGGGWDLHVKLPDEIDLIKPDYSLYPEMDYDMGFTTRGCTRNCYFCVVPKKEGCFRRVQHPSEFHDPEHKQIRLLDNNLLADKEWFFEVTDWVLDNKLKLDINQGLDLRLMDHDVAARLKELRQMAQWRFAFDSMGVKESVVDGFAMLKESGINLRSKCICYVYVHDDSQFESALERCNILKGLNVLPYVMLNQDHQFGGLVKTLRRWTQPAIFFKTSYEEYLESRGDKLY